jgi:hypothetical protein
MGELVEGTRGGDQGAEIREEVREEIREEIREEMGNGWICRRDNPPAKTDIPTYYLPSTIPTNFLHSSNHKWSESPDENRTTRITVSVSHGIRACPG